MPQALPEDVRRFIREHISSIDQLEILLHLFDVAPRLESSEEIARLLYVSPQSVERHLLHFHDHALVSSTGRDPVRFGIESQTSKAGQQIASLAHYYHERRVSVVNEVFSNPTSTIQTFADAFIIGKRKE